MISIDDFRKIELKIATVKSAELHPNADKLMVLQIDLGAEQRQICAGIRNHYTPEEPVGKQVGRRPRHYSNAGEVSARRRKGVVRIARAGVAEILNAE
jgi:hypothetical protein